MTMHRTTQKDENRYSFLMWDSNPPSQRQKTAQPLGLRLNMCCEYNKRVSYFVTRCYKYIPHIILSYVISPAMHYSQLWNLEVRFQTVYSESRLQFYVQAGSREICRGPAAGTDSVVTDLMVALVV
jgi:hypothetical protein